MNRYDEQVRGLRQKAENHRIAAGTLLIEAQQRVLAEEAGKITWKDWRIVNIRRSERDIRKVMRIAGAPDPTAALNAEREKRRVQMANHRANKASVGPVSQTQTVQHSDAAQPKPAFFVPAQSWPQPYEIAEAKPTIVATAQSLTVAEPEQSFEVQLSQFVKWFATLTITQQGRVFAAMDNVEVEAADA